MEGQKIDWEAQKTLAAASISTNYALVGIFSNASRWMWIYNGTQGAMQFSFDGVTDHIAVPSGAAFPVPYAQCMGKWNTSEFPAERTVYVKQISTPTSGSVYVSSLYTRG